MSDYFKKWADKVMKDYAQSTGNNPYAKGGPGNIETLHAEIEKLREEVTSLKKANANLAQANLIAVERLQAMDPVITAVEQWVEFYGPSTEYDHWEDVDWELFKFGARWKIRQGREQ